MPKRKDVLTTGQVAQICQVAPRTVTKWFDSGQLKGYRIPGSRDRRIPTSELIRFMKAHNMPTDQLEKGQTRVLLIDSRPEQAVEFARQLGTKGSFDIQLATNPFDAGLMAEKFRPAVILIQMASPNIDPLELCKHIRQKPELNDACIIALAGGLTTAEAETLIKKGFSAVVTEPTHILKVLECIQEKCTLIF